MMKARLLLVDGRVEDFVLGNLPHRENWNIQHERIKAAVGGPYTTRKLRDGSVLVYLSGRMTKPYPGYNDQASRMDLGGPTYVVGNAILLSGPAQVAWLNNVCFLRL